MHGGKYRFRAKRANFFVLTWSEALRPIMGEFSYDPDVVRDLLDNKEKISKPIFVVDGKQLRVYMPPSIGDGSKRTQILKLVEVILELIFLQL